MTANFPEAQSLTPGSMKEQIAGMNWQSIAAHRKVFQGSRYLLV